MPRGVYLHKPRTIERDSAEACLRREVLIRDEFRCQGCGRQADCVHHIIPRSRPHKGLWEQKNLISLCETCHRVAAARNMKKHYLQYLSVKHGYEYSEAPYSEALAWEDVVVTDKK